jgi:hypothetical protein
MVVAECLYLVTVWHTDSSVGMDTNDLPWPFLLCSVFGGDRHRCDADMIQDGCIDVTSEKGGDHDSVCTLSHRHSWCRCRVNIDLEYLETRVTTCDESSERPAVTTS